MDRDRDLTPGEIAANDQVETAVAEARSFMAHAIGYHLRKALDLDGRQEYDAQAANALTSIAASLAVLSALAGDLSEADE